MSICVVFDYTNLIFNLYSCLKIKCCYYVIANNYSQFNNKVLFIDDVVGYINNKNFFNVFKSNSNQVNACVFFLLTSYLLIYTN